MNDEQKINYLTVSRPWRKPVDYKNKRCTKCKKKAIYIIIYCDPIVKLCIDHAPRLSNGEPGYKKLTIIGHDKIPEHFGLGPQELREAPLDRCYSCDIKVEDENKFIKQGIKNVFFDDKYGMTKQAVPVKEIEYWLCKDDCIEEDDDD